MKFFKKAITIFSALAITSSLSACGGETTSSAPSEMVTYTHKVDIIESAEKGSIPEIPFALGYDVDALKEEFKDTIPQGSEIVDLIEESGSRTTKLHGGNVIFCYQNSKKEKGISYIAAQGDEAYGFAIGGIHTTHDIIDAIKGEEYTLLTGEEAEKDAFLLPVIPENVECLTYEKESYVLKFLFVNDHLSMVSIYDPELWNREKNQ